MPERFHVDSEEVEPGVFELTLQRQEGTRKMFGTAWRTTAVLARGRYLANDMFGLAAFRAALGQGGRDPGPPPP